MDGLFEVLDEARTRGKIGAFGVSSADLRVIAAVTRVRKCRIAQTLVNPLTTEALVTFLTSTREAEDLELVANGVFMDAPPASTETGDRALNSDSLPRRSSRNADLGFTKAQLLIRHAAALGPVKVVLVGTSNPAHLAEDVTALATPATYEDLLA
jgi:aryl-alcohol dehydrogenase-like predicted oxidoreductase